MKHLKAFRGIKFVLLLSLIMILLVLLIVGVSYFTEKNLTVSLLKITNITDSSVTVSFLTNELSNPRVLVSETDNFNLLNQFNSTYFVDDRTSKDRNTHHITIENLKPETKYFFKISTGFKNVDTTYPTLETGLVSDSIQIPAPTYGKFDNVFDDQIIFLTLNSGSELSTILNDNGAFSIDKGNVRTKDLTKPIDFKVGDTLNFKLISLEKRMKFTGIVGEDQPVDIKLEYDDTANVSSNLENRLVDSVLAAVEQKPSEIYCSKKSSDNKMCCKTKVREVKYDNATGTYSNTDVVGSEKDTGYCDSSPANAPQAQPNNLTSSGNQVCSPNEQGIYCKNNVLVNCNNGNSSLKDNCSSRGCNVKDTGKADECKPVVLANAPKTPQESQTAILAEASEQNFCVGKSGLYCNGKKTLWKCDSNKLGGGTSKICPGSCKQNSDPKADECVEAEVTPTVAASPTTQTAEPSFCAISTLNCYNNNIQGSRYCGNLKYCCPEGQKQVTDQSLEFENKSANVCGTVNIAFTGTTPDDSGLNKESCTGTYRGAPARETYDPIQKKRFYCCEKGFINNINNVCVDPKTLNSVPLQVVGGGVCNNNCTIEYRGLQKTITILGDKINGTQRGSLSIDKKANCDFSITNDGNGNCTCKLKEDTCQDLIKGVQDTAVLGTSDTSTALPVADTGTYKVTGTGIESTTKEVKVFDTKDLNIKFFSDLNGDGIKQETEAYITPPTDVKLEKTSDIKVLDLKEGWNLVNMNIVSSNIKTANDLLLEIAKQGGYATHLATYRNGKWVMFSQRAGNKFGDNFNLVPTEGYFLRVHKAVTLKVE
ncbi:MAG: fibronectin type III domain-containing protein, partial [bacterium]